RGLRRLCGGGAVWFSGLPLPQGSVRCVGLLSLGRGVPFLLLLLLLRGCGWLQLLGRVCDCHILLGYVHHKRLRAALRIPEGEHLLQGAVLRAQREGERRLLQRSPV